MYNAFKVASNANIVIGSLYYECIFNILYII